VNGWIEGLVVALFALGWGVIELVALSLDRRTRPEEPLKRDAASGMPALPESGATKSAVTTDFRESR
jgi:hypothetical protein